MKNSKKIKFLISILIFIMITLISNKTKAMLYYEKTGTTTGIVKADVLNVRKGPSTNFGITTKIKKNEYLRVFAKVGNWYVIQTDNNYIGTVSSKYVRLIYNKSENKQNQYVNNKNITSELTEDEKDIYYLINEKRKEHGIPMLKIDDEIQNIARIKAKDMVDNNYFSHNSKTYGSPFDMMKNFGIKYRQAGENIAGNPSNFEAVNAWMDSKDHRLNILNNNFNFTGIGVVKSNKYGKIYVQMFIKK